MSDNQNLLAETIAVLQRNGKRPDDVSWVGVWEKGYKDNPKSFTWDQFAAIADFSYHAGYGGNEVELSLKVVGIDWWLERGEYDGSEWWEFQTLPEQPPPGIPEQEDLKS